MVGKWTFWLGVLSGIALLSIVFSGSGAAEALRAPGAQALSPVQSLVKGIADTSGAFVETLGRLGLLLDENRQLRQQVDELQSQLVSLQEAGEENRRLRALLEYKRDHPGWEYAPATVIAHDPNNLTQSLVIDHGAEDGMKKGMVVVANFGLVGKIVEVYPGTSKVLLVADPSSVISGQLQRSRAQGVVAGRADRSMEMQYIEKGVDVIAGEMVVTSGLGGGFPSGIPMAKVVDVIEKDQALFKTISLAPIASLDSVRDVLVIKDFMPVSLP